MEWYLDLKLHRNGEKSRRLPRAPWITLMFHDLHHVLEIYATQTEMCWIKQQNAENPTAEIFSLF